jgi:hypothetical protein
LDIDDTITTNDRHHQQQKHICSSILHHSCTTDPKVRLCYIISAVPRIIHICLCVFVSLIHYPSLILTFFLHSLLRTHTHNLFSN